MGNSHNSLTRRAFLGGAGAAVASGALAALPPGLAQAMAEPRRRGSIDDVEHVVILMQENRSFDHYYGTMRGVRGFSDKAAVTLPGGRSVLYQPDPQRADGGFLLPFHVDTSRVDGEELGGTDHSWGTTHAAADGGRWDGWVPAKSETTMAYFERADIPFQRALAEAFTICDAYFCSIQGPTTPNRLYLWTGTIDPDGRQGGPATFNPPDYNPVYGWTTYPERLQAAGVSWQVYANHEVGDGADGWVGDYGDNPLWLFHAYHDALASPDPKTRQLAERAAVIQNWLPDSGQGRDVDHVLAQFISDCRAGTLPAVSWVVAPYLWSEHPTARPSDGAVYQQRVIQALWENPDLWESTVLLVNYDENDGLFDHLLPPQAPPGTPGEVLSPLGTVASPGAPQVPIGLGPRVPMTVVSPWSRGGWVNSQVHDHTSVIRFLEAWTGVAEPNISGWRRAMCGDLTGCFDFSRPTYTTPSLPAAGAFAARIDPFDSALPAPAPPAEGQQVPPVQDSGDAPARPLPYQPMANVAVAPGAGAVRVTMSNAGAATLQLSVFDHATPGAAPRFVDLGGRGEGAASVPTVAGSYDVAVHGPNGFLRRFAGDGAGGVEAALTLTGPGAHPALALTVTNTGASPAVVTVEGSGPDGSARQVPVPPRSSEVLRIDPLGASHGWYDLSVAVEGQASFLRRFAGHLENGLPSVTG